MIRVGSRPSKLALLQVDEIFAALSRFHPDTAFEKTIFQTPGDLDKVSSLRPMSKDDFFTRELDEALLEGEIDIAIHSAKDLPDPLPQGLKIVALTHSIDPRDALVLQKEMAHGMVIATSSENREKNVRALGYEVNFTDVRGTIQERLALVEKGEVDGVVIAEAALIRLSLTHLNRLYLPGETTPLQGCLAVLAHENHSKMEDLFECINQRSVCSTPA